MHQITTLLCYSWSLLFPNIEIQKVNCFTPTLESSRVLTVNLTPKTCTTSKIHSPSYTVAKFTLIHTCILRLATQYQSFMGEYDHVETWIWSSSLCYGCFAVAPLKHSNFWNQCEEYHSQWILSSDLLTIHPKISAVMFEKNFR